MRSLRGCFFSKLSGLYVATVFCGVPLSAQQVIAGSPIHCDYDTNAAGTCTLTEFNRSLNQIYDGATKALASQHPPVRKQVDAASDPVQVWAINSPASKILFSGTLIFAPVSGTYDQAHPDPGAHTCADYDWKITVLSNESSNILFYGPADVASYCVTRGEADHSVDWILIVAPVAVRSADIFHYSGGSDPLRKAPGPVSAPPSYCGVKLAPGLPPATPEVPSAHQAGGIHPCDYYTRIGVLYNNAFGKLYNRLTQPGTSQGTITIVPAIGKVPTGGLSSAKAPATTLSYDVQIYPSGIWGPGWIGFPIVFEKANAATANLDSLSMALSYDMPFTAIKPYLAGPVVLGSDENGTLTRFAVRPPDVRVQYGLELGTAWPNDLNTVAAGTIRLPMVFDFHNEPSAMTLFPVVGLEGGNHIWTHAIGAGSEPGIIFRKVAGFDSSLRVPFVLTHAFLGDKPTTVDFSWRTRYLSYREPFTDYVSGVAETLSKQQRTYWRGTYTVPISTLISFKVTLQHGGLPPDFHYLGYTVNIGLTFANPGYSEH